MYLYINSVYSKEVIDSYGWDRSWSLCANVGLPVTEFPQQHRWVLCRGARQQAPHQRPRFPVQGGRLKEVIPQGGRDALRVQVTVIVPRVPLGKERQTDRAREEDE